MFFFAAATMSLHSFTVIAIGFSVIACRPALQASITAGACTPFGVQTSTASIFPFIALNMASQGFCVPSRKSASFGRPHFSCIRSRRSWTMSHPATTSALSMFL